MVIKTRRPACSLVTRIHRSKTDMTDVILIDMWVSSLRGRFTERADMTLGWLKSERMSL